MLTNFKPICFLTSGIYKAGPRTHHVGYFFNAFVIQYPFPVHPHLFNSKQRMEFVVVAFLFYVVSMMNASLKAEELTVASDLVTSSFALQCLQHQCQGRSLVDEALMSLSDEFCMALSREEGNCSRCICPTEFPSDALSQPATTLLLRQYGGALTGESSIWYFNICLFIVVKTNHQ